MNYEEMSGFEINMHVALANDYLVMEMDDKAKIGMTPDFHKNYPDIVWVAEHEHGVQTMAWEQFCPTLSISDAWPIITEDRIALVPAFDIWDASKGDFNHDRRNFQVQDKNPLRAAMIVFLKLKEAP